jgi:hypothetical protein
MSIQPAHIFHKTYPLEKLEHAFAEFCAGQSSKPLIEP